MKSLINAVRQCLIKLVARYKVVAVFPNMKGSTSVKIHYAVSWSDARQWMACYQAGDTVVVYECLLGRAAQVPVGWRF